MPKINFEKTVIYQLTCPTFDDIYVNYTSNIYQRRYVYTHENRSGKNSFFKTIHEHGGFSNWNMIILDKSPKCKNINDIKEKVKEWVNKLTPQNPVTPSFSPERSMDDNKNCKNCGKTFTRIDNLHRHILNRCKHKEEVNNVPTNNEKVCELQSILTHILSINPNVTINIYLGEA